MGSLCPGSQNYLSIAFTCTFERDLVLRIFGNDLAALRRSKGLTVGQLAARLGCHPSYITHVEKGRRLPPGSARLRQFMSALGASDEEAARLQQAAVWTFVMSRVENLGYSRPERLVSAAAQAYLHAEI
ncbi:helix-turn-helix domain-containing protein [Castellaniella sp.]|uniref:helix-turn-helix domain-containing protein n=1 Tax=Castellaniella sp. TaxID=1955812 RepID=UPI003A923085